MPITITCPGCNAGLKMAAAPAPGKKIKCPKCAHVFAPMTDDEPEERPAPVPAARDDDDYEDDRPAKKSKKSSGRSRSDRPFTFDGGAGDFFVTYILMYLLILVTLGIGTPWAMCMVQRWRAEHSIVEGRRLRFVATGGELFVKFIVMYLLVAITCGIYSFWAVPEMIRWFDEHTEFE